MKKFFMVAVAALTMTAMQASAALIFGSVGFSGNVVTPIMGGANSITFSTLPNGTEGTVTASTGDLLRPFLSGVDVPVFTLTAGAGNTIANFVFNFGTYTFTATSFVGSTLVSNNPSESSRSIVLNGIYAKGADSNGGSLLISFQNPQTANPDTYSASGSTVPEPATYAMLGSALLGLGLLRRRKA